MHAQLFVGVHVILEKDGKIFLIRRANTGYRDGCYSVPAGGVEKTEFATKTIVREAKEEAGITILESDLDFVHVLHMVKPNKPDDRMQVFFTARLWTGEPHNAEPAKCDDAGWYVLDSLPENIVPYVKQALEHIKIKSYFSEITD